MANKYKSETSMVRPLLLKYCQGYGCDIGFGGDKIVKENCVGIDLPIPYANCGQDKNDLPCDVTGGIPVEANTFDYVYSSHLIEDFEEETLQFVLTEFIRIAKHSSRIILVFPDQQKYLALCEQSHVNPNASHKNPNFGIKYVKDMLQLIKNPFFEYCIIEEKEPIGLGYSCYIVLGIIKAYMEDPYGTT